MMQPSISIIMPTFNSEKTIEKSLISIRKQNYDQDKVEILVIDGGSTDNTVLIAQKYNCKVIENPKKLPETAKKIGIMECSGDYFLYVDSDELFINENSLMKRVEIFENNKKIKSITATGKISLKDAGAIVKYSNYVSDPFSYFVYQLDGNNRYEEMMKKYKMDDAGEFVVFNYAENETLPLFDAAMNMFETKYVRLLFEDCDDKDAFSANIFQYTVDKTRKSAMLKDDFIYHIPDETLKSYLKKMKWRVYNNVFLPKGEGIGFASRSKGDKKLQYRKIMYVLYSCLLLPVLIDTVRIMLKKKSLIYGVHFIINEYVMFWIGVYMILKMLGKRPNRENGYGK